MSLAAPSGPSTPPQGNPFARLLSPENILLELDVSSKQRVFEAVGRLFAQRLGCAQAQVIEGLAAREKLGSTGLGQGMAIPHARLQGLRHEVAAFVRMRFPIAYDAPDGKPVTHLLVLLVPEHGTEEHLQILACAAQMFADRRFREQLGLCVDAQEVCRLFANGPQP